MAVASLIGDKAVLKMTESRVLKLIPFLWPNVCVVQVHMIKLSGLTSGIS